MLIQSTGMSSAMPHHGALSNRGHSRTGQNSLLASTEALLKAVSYQFPSGVLSAGNQSCFCGSTCTNKYLDEISLFGKQISTCSGNAAAQVTSLWYHLVASKHSLWERVNSVCIGGRAHGFRYIISLCGFPAVFTRNTFTEQASPSLSQTHSFLFHLGLILDASEPKGVPFLQPALLPVTPWMCFCGCNIRQAEHKRRPHWITTQQPEGWL